MTSLLTRLLEDIGHATQALEHSARMAEHVELRMRDNVERRDEAHANDERHGAVLWRGSSPSMSWVAFWQKRTDEDAALLDRYLRLIDSDRAHITDLARDYGRAMIEAECQAVSA